MSRSSHRGVFLVLLTGLCALSGCGSTSPPQSSDEKNLQALAVAIGQYRGSHKGQPPPNIEALKTHLKKAPQSVSGSSVEPVNVDAMFVSSRDGKPYVYRPSKSGGVPMPGPDGKVQQTVVWYEVDGKAGRRYVAYDLGGVELVDSTKFKQLVPEAP